jgi:putative transposase
MPWMEVTLVAERLRFIFSVDSDENHNFAAICRSFNISRKTGYKWIKRYEKYGEAGLEDDSHIPLYIPHRVSIDIVTMLIEARKLHPTWGPKKLKNLLEGKHPDIKFPACSTIGEWLHSYGLIHSKKQRIKTPVFDKPLTHGLGPNDLWCADFKGNFLMGDAKKCYPLTITDEYSRFLLKCEGLLEPKEDPTHLHFELCFREYGLPNRIKTDNGVPFATTAVGGLSKLSIWWIKQGIQTERIEPGHPEQNGRHERMHRTLKAESTKPPGSNILEQQLKFDRFRGEYNLERPHEALNQKTPNSQYQTSNREYRENLKDVEYGDEYERRRVQPGGDITWQGSSVKIGIVLTREIVGIKEKEENCWEAYYGPVKLGELSKTKKGIEFKKQ